MNVPTEYIYANSEAPGDRHQVGVPAPAPDVPAADRASPRAGGVVMFRLLFRRRRLTDLPLSTRLILAHVREVTL